MAYKLLTQIMQDKLKNIREHLSFLSQQLLNKGKEVNLSQEQLINIHKQIGLLESIDFREDIKKKEQIKKNIIKEHIPQKKINNLLELYKKNNFKKAEIEARKFKEIYVDNPIIYEVLAMSCLWQKNLFDALTFMIKAVELEPKNSNYLINLGYIYKELNRFDKAKEIYNNAINLNANHYLPYYNLATLLQKEGRFEEAKDKYIKAINLNPNYSRAYNNLANTLTELGMRNKAYCNKLNFDNSYINEDIKINIQENIEFNMRNTDDVIKNYIKALEIKPNSISTWNNIYFSLFMMKYMQKDNKKLLENYFKNKKFSTINYALLEYKLNMGEKYSKLFLSRAVKTIKENTNNIIANPNHKNRDTKIDINLPKKIIAIIHFGRSGTGFLHSLIDNHSEITTLPSIYFNHFFNDFVWEDIIKDGWNGMIDRFIDSYAVLFDSRVEKPVPTSQSFGVMDYQGVKEGMTSLGESKKDFLFIDKDLFKRELFKLIANYKKIDPLIFFKLIHLAYERVLNNNNNKSTIFYHIHNPDPYTELNFLGLANDVNWLLTVRDPIEGCESWITKEFISNNYKDLYTKIFTVLRTINHPIFNENNSVGVRLDDLKVNPKSTMKTLCNWIGIKEEETLYQMTAQGKKWWGDHSSTNQEGFGRVNKTKLGKVFSEKDKFILKTIFYPFRVKFNYTEENQEKFKKDLKTIRPMINKIFDFEKKIALKNNIDEKIFITSGWPLLFRTALLSSWEMLNKYHTYPNMIKLLKVL